MGKQVARCRAEGVATLAGTRVCLRPDRCPFTLAGPCIGGDPADWERVLLELLPGDPDLASDIAAAVAAGSDPLEALDVEDEDRGAADLDLDGEGDDELDGLGTRRRGVDLLDPPPGAAP